MGGSGDWLDKINVLPGSTAIKRTSGTINRQQQYEHEPHIAHMKL